MGQRASSFVIALVLLACGRFSVEDAARQLQDEEIEPRVATFSCGAASCNAGKDVCCGTESGEFACRSTDAGCGEGEDGGAAGAGLACTTYKACPEGTDCCYQRDQGASCKARCSPSESRLCRAGEDSCGRGNSCEAMEAPPAPDTGECQSDGGGRRPGGGGPGGGGFGGGGFGGGM